jgi:hypothetical protein
LWFLQVLFNCFTSYPSASRAPISARSRSKLQIAENKGKNEGRPPVTPPELPPSPMDGLNFNPLRLNN